MSQISLSAAVVIDVLRVIALIFGMLHYLVDFYQVCPNYAPRAKIGPAPGVTCFT